MNEPTDDRDQHRPAADAVDAAEDADAVDAADAEDAVDAADAEDAAGTASESADASVTEAATEDTDAPPAATGDDQMGTTEAATTEGIDPSPAAEIDGGAEDATQQLDAVEGAEPMVAMDSTQSTATIEPATTSEIVEAAGDPQHESQVAGSAETADVEVADAAEAATAAQAPEGDVEAQQTGPEPTALPPAADAPEGTTDRRRQRHWWQLPRSTVVVYSAVFVATEALGAFVDVNLQAALAAVAALIAVNHAIFGYRTQRTAGLVMAALFVSRLTTIAFPIPDASLTTRAGTIGAISLLLFALATWVLRTDVAGGRASEGFPLKRPLLTPSFTAALTVLLGFPLGWAASQLLAPHPIVAQPIAGYAGISWVIAVGCLLVSAAGEELLYRRLVAAMVQHTGQSQTPWISAALYGATFLGTHDIGYIALATGVGALFTWSCERTGSIRPVIAAHFVINVLVFVVLPG